MAKRGPKPNPSGVKAARGTSQPCREAPESNVVEFPVVEKHPDPPSYLNESGIALWNDMVPKLMGQRLLTEADLYLLRHLCRLHGQIEEDYGRRVEPTASLLGRLVTMFAEFGMSPSSRKRVAARGWLLDEFQFPMQHAVMTFTTYADRHARGERDAECEALRIEARRMAAEFLVLEHARVLTGAIDAEGFDTDLAQIYDWPPQEAENA